MIQSFDEALMRSSTPEQRLEFAWHMYWQRRAHKVPTTTFGHWDSKRIWHPDEREVRDCCREISPPSRRFPFSYLRHCCTIRHIATLWEIDESQARRAFRQRWAIAQLEEAAESLGSGRGFREYVPGQRYQEWTDRGGLTSAQHYYWDIGRELCGILRRYGNGYSEMNVVAAQQALLAAKSDNPHLHELLRRLGILVTKVLET